MLSQIEPNENIYKLLVNWGIQSIHTVEDLVLLRDKMYHVLTFRPYNDSTKEAERQIRWKRTGAQILEDGYAYEGKACTDLVVAYLTLARAAGVKNTRFVKLRNNETGTIHSVAELELEGDWYVFDVSRKDFLPTKSEIKEGVLWNGFLLWKKGKDSWNIGLTDYESQSKVLK